MQAVYPIYNQNCSPPKTHSIIRKILNIIKYNYTDYKIKTIGKASVIKINSTRDQFNMNKGIQIHELSENWFKIHKNIFNFDPKLL